MLRVLGCTIRSIRLLSTAANRSHVNQPCIVPQTGVLTRLSTAVNVVVIHQPHAGCVRRLVGTNLPTNHHTIALTMSHFEIFALSFWKTESVSTDERLTWAYLPQASPCLNVNFLQWFLNARSWPVRSRAQNIRYLSNGAKSWARISVHFYGRLLGCLLKKRSTFDCDYD